VAGASLLTVTGPQIVGADVSATKASSDTGFSRPFAGSHRFESLAPTQLTNPDQLNEPVGQERADEIAAAIGLDKDKVLNEAQYIKFISGQGNKGDLAAAALADRSVQIFTNTNGRPLTSDVDGVPTDTVLASYGLFVSKDGWLESLANEFAPTRQANILLAPVTGYITQWFLANHARRSLIQLYRSAYTVSAFYGILSQGSSSKAQLVTNTKGSVTTQVGMSMAPALWLTNFALLYTLKPELAAAMPAYWAPIPDEVARAMMAEREGRVRYSAFASFFPESG
jgi:hypothetical protein